jgi:hypothetical protein
MIKIDITLTGAKYAYHDEMSLEAAKAFIFGFKAAPINESGTVHVSLDIYRSSKEEARTQWRHVRMTSVYSDVLLDMLDALEAKENLSKAIF